MMESSKTYYVGVDVGTSSARAALIDGTGHIHRVSTQSICMHEPNTGFYEQSSDDIWEACCKCVQSVVSGIEKKTVQGIGFDATCSLVILNQDCKPLSVSPKEGSHEVDGEMGETRIWDVIMWMDHRAEQQAAKINATNHEVLRYVGGAVSLEMQTPKILWLKENKTEIWNQAEHFMDLPDFLTWRATGSLSRSQCSLVCKWTYIAGPGTREGWSSDFFEQIGLSDLLRNNASKIGSQVLTPGSPCGMGLSERAAADFHLLPGTPVGTSVIDAHAGGIGSLGCQVQQKVENFIGNVDITSRLALICGTSTCHMALVSDPLFVPGIWGPYYSTMVPGLWSNEGGQSIAGKLIDHVIENHSAYEQLKLSAEEKDTHIHSVLNQLLEDLADQKKVSVAELTHDLHMWPDYHGNRSPLNDASLKGMLCGLTLATGPEALALEYLAAVQALTYGTRHIIKELEQHGHDIKALYMCGGLRKNPLFVQTHADATGLPIILPHTSESVLLGAAILGANASGNFPSIQAAMHVMGGDGNVVLPDTTLKHFHEKKYRVFRKMVEHQREYRAMMQ